MKKSATVSAVEVIETPAIETAISTVGERHLATNGIAVVITGAGKVKRVYPKVDDIDVKALGKESLITNNKILFEAIKGEFEKASITKGWISVQGFKLRFAPAGFEMYDMENHKTPIDLGETPTIMEVVKFIKKPSIKKLTENRKTVAPKKAEPKAEVVVVPELTDEEQRTAGLKNLATYARKDVRFVEEMRVALNDQIKNRKYRTQLGKLFKDFLEYRPATQKKNFPTFVKALREHLKGFDFTPAPIKAPKFTGLEELDYSGGIEIVAPKMVQNNPTKESVLYKTSAGKFIEMGKVKFLCHDILYNWPDYFVSIMKVAKDEMTIEQVVEDGLVQKDIFCEFEMKLIEAAPADKMLALIEEIYLWQEEVSPLEFVYNSTLKLKEKVKIYWPDMKVYYSGLVSKVSPLEVAYEFGEMLPVLQHQKVKTI